MIISMELFLMVQVVSTFCLLTALSQTAVDARPRYGRLVMASLISAGGTQLIFLFGNQAAHVLGAVLLNLTTPFVALEQLPLQRRLYTSFTYLLLNLTLEGSLRLMINLHVPALPAVLIASAGTLMLPRMRRRTHPMPITRVEIRWHDRSVCLNALMDTGNLLWDPVTGLPVVVCSRQAMGALLPKTFPGALPEGFRLLSVRTAAGGTLMPCFRPESVRLLSAHGWVDTAAIIGLSTSGYSGFQALIPAAMLQSAVPHTTSRATVRHGG